MFGKPKQSEKPSASSVSFGEFSINESAPCQKSLKLRVKPEAIKPIRAAVLAEFQKEASLPGFRKGKAPAELIERQYGKSIHDETLNRVTKTTLEETTKAQALKPVGPFEVRSANFSESDGFTFEATVEVEPAFELAGYKGIEVGETSNTVSAEELEKALKSLQESAAELAPVKEAEEAKEKKIPALDDELAKDLGLKDLAALKEHVEAKLKEQKRSEQARNKEVAISEELLRRHGFDVPKRLVEHQTEKLTRDFAMRLLLSGVAEDKVKEELAKFTEELRTSAERHVKLLFILDRIADKESVEITQQELVERLWQLSQRWKKDPVEVRKILDAQGMWGSVTAAIRQEKTMGLLIAAATVKKGASSPALKDAAKTETAKSKKSA